MNRALRFMFPLTVALCTQLHGEEVALDFVRYAEESNGYQPPGQQILTLTLNRPEGTWTFPATHTERPVYAWVNFADDPRLIMLGCAKPGDELFTQIYFDANCNRDLTDDPPVTGPARVAAAQERRSGYVQFPTVETVVRRNGADLPFRFRFYVSATRLDEVDLNTLTPTDLEQRFECGLEPACCYTGVLSVAGRTFNFALADSNGNGRFTDLARFEASKDVEELQVLKPQGDTLYVTEEDDIGEHDAETLCDQLLLASRLFDVVVDEAAQMMHLTPITNGLERLNLARQARHLVLESQSDGRCLVMIEPGLTARLPAGAYRLLGYQLRTRGDYGDLWQVRAAAAQQTPFLNAGTELAVLEFGEPYRAEVHVPTNTIREWQDGGELGLALGIRGTGGERMTDVRRLAGTRSKTEMSSIDPDLPRDASYRILQSDGEIVAQGDFEYG